MPFRSWGGQVLCRITPSRCGRAMRQQWSKREMMNFTLSKAQEDFREYAHQIALQEMRPISLECDRTEQIPESFFWNMQARLRTGQARQAQGEERQGNLLSLLSQEEMAWGDAAL